MKVISIVIPVFNKWNFTKSCLEDLAKLPEDHEIIVIDNGSSDETQVELKHRPGITYHCEPVNLGFAKACNLGYSLATASKVLFLNNDIRVKSNFENWTKELIQYSDHYLVGPTMGQLDDQLNFVQEANQLLPGKSYMSGWCLAASKEIWSILTTHKYQGPFSEEFGLAYFEDTDLSFRARKLGIHMKVVDLPVVHFGKQTSRQLNTHQLYSQARQIFVRKWSSK